MLRLKFCNLLCKKQPGRKVLVVNNAFVSTGFAGRAFGCDPVENSAYGYDQYYQSIEQYMIFANWNATTAAGKSAAANLPNWAGRDIGAGASGSFSAIKFSAPAAT